MKSIQTRMKVAALGLAVFCTAFVWWGVKQETTASNTLQLHEVLRSDADLLAKSFEVEDGEVLVPDAVVSAVTHSSRGPTEWAVLDPTGAYLVGNHLGLLEMAREAEFDHARSSEERFLAPVVYFSVVRQVEIQPGQPSPYRAVLVRGNDNVVEETESVGHTLLFWVGLMGAGIASVVGLAVLRAFRPVRLATDALERGARADPETMPTEIRPFVERINTLLDQQQETLDRERQFTGNVAHELRTPLSVLQMGLQLLGRRIGEHQQETVTDLRETVDEMSTLVENLLSLSRSESTQAQSAVEVAPIVETVWMRLEDQADARGLTFESTLAAGDTIHASEDGLRAILSNLLSNAVEYTEDNGHIVVERPADGLLAVWDSGPVPDQLDRMFDRLWRADEARTEATKHAGLGLSIARSLAESMGLELVADAPAQGGLRFLLRRPKASAVL